MGCGKPTNPIGPIHSAGCVCDVVTSAMIKSRSEINPC
ncbi:CotZ OS=Lysinibacillus sphaericus CBAM5 OX=1400869 GN=P799_01915 PE=4 SV=1 [Lysinibacillus sphaericus]